MSTSRKDLLSRSVLHGEAFPAGDEVEASLAHEPVPEVAAFFDVDNTIMQGASIFHLARGLHSRKFFTTRDLLAAAYKQAYFRVVGSEDPQHVEQAKASALAFIKGHRIDELEQIADEIFDETMADRIWPGTKALAQSHIDRGERVWLVTAAPVEVARVIARRLGLTGALGTVAETEGGVYTGRLIGDLLHGPEKAVAIQRLAEREGLDLSRCSAYSDSFNDVPMLSLVGHPYAINPDARLRALAAAKGWPIRDYRTGRKMAKAGLVAAASAGAVAGATVATLTLRRRIARV